MDQVAKHMAENLGGKLLSAYVTTGQYDVVATVEMPNGEPKVMFGEPHIGDRQCAHDHRPRLPA